MRPRDPVYPFPQGAFPVHNIGNHNHVSSCKSYSGMEIGFKRQESFSFGAMLSSNIPDVVKARKDLPLPDSQVGVFEPLLYGTLIHAALTLQAYVQ